MHKILCLTPIKHIEGVFDRLSKLGGLIYVPNPPASGLVRKLVARRLH